MKQFFFYGLFFTATLTLIPSLSQARDSVQATSSIQEFHQVNAHIYRGGRPGEQGLQELKSLGIHTVISVEDNDAAMADEKAGAAELGIGWIGSRMSAWTRPSDQQINDLLNQLQDPNLFPIYIHCHHGQDRTGLVLGLYRVFMDKWTPKAAYDEMLQYHFHPSLWALDGYFKDRSGYSRATALEREAEAGAELLDAGMSQ